MPRPKRQHPRSYSTDWPSRPCADPIAEVARRFAINLANALGEHSNRAGETLTRVHHTVIGDILNGTTWPDLATIARLESGLEADLWPRRDSARKA